MKRQDNTRAPNGHAAQVSRANGKTFDGNGICKTPNGHDLSSLERGGASARGDHAASDDEGGAFAKGSANSSATRANRETSADAAPSPRSGRNGRGHEARKPEKKEKIEFPGPTDPAAMQDSQAFADAVGEKIDLVAASASLLQSADEKIRKAELDRIREMKFGKVAASAAPAEEPFTVDWTGVPRPSR
jgi:hypothetical protein